MVAVTPWPASLAGVANALGVDLALVGDTHRLRDGVIGERLRQGLRPRAAIARYSRLRVYCHDRERAVGERAGLVEDDGVHVGERLEVVRTLDENAQLGGAADAAKEAQRHADHERARQLTTKKVAAQESSRTRRRVTKPAAEREYRAAPVTAACRRGRSA